VGPVTVDCDSLALTDRDQHLNLYSDPRGSSSAESAGPVDNVIGTPDPHRELTGPGRQPVCWNQIVIGARESGTAQRNAIFYSAAPDFGGAPVKPVRLLVGALAVTTVSGTFFFMTRRMPRRLPDP
jgi:hypothetical protein